MFLGSLVRGGCDFEWAPGERTISDRRGDDRLLRGDLSKKTGKKKKRISQIIEEAASPDTGLERKTFTIKASAQTLTTGKTN